MALETNSIRFLAAARKQGARFDRTITLGRQHLFVSPKIIEGIMSRHGLSLDKSKFENALKSCVFSEPFFEALGAQQVDSMDNAEYEGANRIHDLNQPLPSEWKEQYDAVYDGGTLEHVFNFPIALRNAMELLRPEGRLFIHTCANNACGHGFYQFSPELFFRVLSPENGFEVERIVVHRTGPYGHWYEVIDPEKIHERVELISFMPISMLIQAKRMKVMPIFEKMPQQTVYANMWEKKRDDLKIGWFRKFFPKISMWLSPFKTGIEFYHRQSLFNRRFFKPVKK